MTVTVTYSPYWGLDKPIPIPTRDGSLRVHTVAEDSHRSWCEGPEKCANCCSAPVLLPLPSLGEHAVAEFSAEEDERDADERASVYMVMPSSSPDDDADMHRMAPDAAIQHGLNLIKRALTGPPAVEFDLSTVSTNYTGTVKLSGSDAFAVASKLIETAFLATQD